MVGAVHLSLAGVYYPAMMAGGAGAVGLATAGAMFHWLEILPEDKRTILLRAAAHAQRAVDFQMCRGTKARIMESAAKL